jgi:hypothetical protein
LNTPTNDKIDDLTNTLSAISSQRVEDDVQQVAFDTPVANCHQLIAKLFLAEC